METPTRQPPARHIPGKVTLAIAGAAIVAVGIVVALLGGPDVTEYPPGTPEAAAQNYVQALFDGDTHAAHAVLGTEIQQNCEPFQLGQEPWLEDGTARFTDVRVNGAQATIDVRITSTNVDFEPSPFNDNEIESRLVLESTNGEWRIVRADWPFDGCIRR